MHAHAHRKHIHTANISKLISFLICPSIEVEKDFCLLKKSRGNYGSLGTSQKTVPKCKSTGGRLAEVRLALGSWPISIISSNVGAFDVALSDQDLCGATVLVSFCHLDTS